MQVAPEQQEPRELRLESRHGSPPAMQEEDRASASEDAEIPTQRRPSSLRPIPLSHRAEVSETESGERILHPHPQGFFPQSHIRIREKVTRFVAPKDI